jgi:hypothetical protein
VDCIAYVQVFGTLGAAELAAGAGGEGAAEALGAGVA